MSSLNYMELCRLCLVKERVSIPIFEGEGDVRQIFLKIASCLPVKVARDDKLPKKICDDCMFKLDSAYQFWNTTANAEKQLLQWLGEVSNEDKKAVPSNTIETEQLVLKEEAVEQETSDITKTLSRVEAVLDDERGGSDDEDTESEEEGSNSEDSGDDEPPGKEEAESEEEEEAFEPLEPTTFVNVSLAGSDEAGPSGIQQPAQTATSAQQQMAPPPSQQQQQVAPSTSSAVVAAAPVVAAPSASGCAPEAVTRGHGGDSSSNPAPPSIKLEDKLISSKQCWKLFPESQLQVDTMFHDTYDMDAAIKVEVKMGSDNEVAESEDYSLTYNESGEAHPFACSSCPRRFKRSRDVIVHERTHGKPVAHKCDICGYTTTDSFYFKIHQKRHEQQFNCDVCGKGCHSQNKLEAHKSSHGDMPFRCLICDKQYACKKTLFNHKRMFHSDADEMAKFHSCDVCGKAFPKKSSLLYHSISHSGEKPYKCDKCDKAYPYKYNLAAHKKTIHSETPTEKVRHQCEMCGKTYAHKRSLLLHMNSHTGANVYICDVCGKSLSNKDHLKFHCRIHTGEKPNICDICGKSFSKPFDMKQHRRIHTGERPYKCDMCPKAFTQRSTLVIHKRYHTGQRPYQCELCDKDFVCRALLNVHMKSHTSKSDIVIIQ